MTKQEFVMWLEAHECTLSPFQAMNSNSPTLIINNKVNGREAYLSLPINDRPMKDATICNTCLRLLIPVPEGIICITAAFK